MSTEAPTMPSSRCPNYRPLTRLGLPHELFAAACRSPSHPVPDGFTVGHPGLVVFTSIWSRQAAGHWAWSRVLQYAAAPAYTNSLRDVFECIFQTLEVRQHQLFADQRTAGRQPASSWTQQLPVPGKVPFVGVLRVRGRRHSRGGTICWVTRRCPREFIFRACGGTSDLTLETTEWQDAGTFTVSTRTV